MMWGGVGVGCAPEEPEEHTACPGSVEQHAGAKDTAWHVTAVRQKPPPIRPSAAGWLAGHSPFGRATGSCLLSLLSSTSARLCWLVSSGVKSGCTLILSTLSTSYLPSRLQGKGVPQHQHGSRWEGHERGEWAQAAAQVDVEGPPAAGTPHRLRVNCSPPEVVQKDVE